jgi:hypothetical protein
MRGNLGVDTLIGAGDQAVAFFDFGVDAAVASRPIGVFAEQADSPGDKEFHGGLVKSVQNFIDYKVIMENLLGLTWKCTLNIIEID